MKNCPTCSRTFEDTFTFCLVDGAILSAPFDPQTTQRIPALRHTGAPPTEVLSSNVTSEALPATTLPSLPPTYKPSQSSAAPQLQSFIARALSSTLDKIIFGAICGLVAGAIAAPILSFPLKAEVVLIALPIGVLHGLVIGFILIPLGKVLGGRVRTALIGGVIGIIVGLGIRAIIVGTTHPVMRNTHWYYSTSDGVALEVIIGASLGILLGAVYGSKKTAR